MCLVRPTLFFTLLSHHLHLYITDGGEGSGGKGAEGTTFGVGELKR